MHTIPNMMMNVPHKDTASNSHTKLTTMIKDEQEELTKVEADKQQKSESPTDDDLKKSNVEKSEDHNKSDASQQRYLPKNKKPDAALTFPEKVRCLSMH